MQSMSQSNFKQKEISQILLKPNFKAFWQSEAGFQKCGFLYPSSRLRDFIPPKSPGLIGLINGKDVIQKEAIFLEHKTFLSNVKLKSVLSILKQIQSMWTQMEGSFLYLMVFLTECCSVKKLFPKLYSKK